MLSLVFRDFRESGLSASLNSRWRRTGGRLLKVFKERQYPNGIGPGINLD